MSASHPRSVVLVGAESVGKSTLAAALSGTRSRADNVAGSTVAAETFSSADRIFVDTPGIVHRADTEATRLAVAALADDEHGVLLVLRATHLDDELAELLPLVSGRRGVVAVTQWDRITDTPTARDGIAALSAEAGVPFVPLDARNPGTAADELHQLLDSPGLFTSAPLRARVGWRVQPPQNLLDHRWAGPALGLVILVAPAVAVVWAAVTLSGWAEPAVETMLDPLSGGVSGLPSPLAELLAGDYGLLTMGPLLLVWALPVVVALAVLLGILRASGLLDRITTAVHPLLRPFGLTGRDLVRVVAGFGCNVPAVIATRSCSSCSRDATIGAIGFGSACSYQLGATLAVLAAAQRPALVAPYLAVLVGGALVHARIVGHTAGVSRALLDVHLLAGRAFLMRPRWVDVWREARSTLTHVTWRALPVFGAITVVASLLSTYGLIEVLGTALAPVLTVVRLPSDVVVPITAATLRKDGLLLMAEPSVLAGLDDAQLLAALLLAGALVPCLVTVVTIGRERTATVAVRLVAMQACLTILLAATVSWLGAGWWR